MKRKLGIKNTEAVADGKAIGKRIESKQQLSL